MADSRVFTGFTGGRPSPQAGIISKIRLENFMCHSSLEIELGDRVNFVTGQNGSGKSAILTALCVAFGCRARGTQRATTMKDFIKNNCSYALVHVELKNQGQDAFRPDKYGDLIVIERRINESSTTTSLKDSQGKKIAGQSKDLRELVEHFNIDVENPCVIMTQDKSREFLHSGNNKDKFKFFFKATLLHQVDALLKTIEGLLHGATELVRSLEESISPVLKELDELQAKIKSMEHIEEISQQVRLLKKKLAWTWVYDVDKQLQQQSTKIEKLQAHISTIKARVDQKLGKVEELRDHLAKKRAQIANMVESTSEVTRKKEELQQSLSLAARERLELEEERGRKINRIQKLVKQMNTLEQQICDINEQHMKDTQDEEYEMGQKLKELQDELNETNLSLGRLKKEEDALSESLAVRMDEIKRTTSEIEEFDRKCREISFSIGDLRLHQTNKVTAFGGNKVITLLQAIERHAFRFKRPPIGPIGAHLALKNGDMWAPAVENAIGKLLQAFIVTDHKDSLLLRSCAREANYHNLQIIVYDFSRPRLHIPSQMLPQTKHQTILSVVHSDNSTVINVLIDMGNVERQVLVRDYVEGKLVAFDQRILNLKEVYTLEGHRMFSRGSSQTILPPNKNARGGRLCSSYDEQIKNLRRDEVHLKEQVQLGHAKKRNLEEACRSLQDEFQRAKRSRVAVERELNQKSLKLQDMKTSYAVESSAAPASSVDELQGEFSKFQNEKQANEKLIENIEIKMKEAETRANDYKISFQNLCESAKVDIDALEEAERELMQLEDDLQSAEAEKRHYENIISEKLPSDIKEAESQYRELQETRKESYRKASIICAESEIQELGGCHGNTPEQLSAQLSRLNQRLQRESQRYPEPIDDLKMLYEKKKCKIQRKQQTYKAMRDKVNACRQAIDLRWCKFQRNATQLRRQLTWQFNRHLGKKGISGSIKVSYQEETLSVEVKMPHDASSSSVRDTRGLSGGERSFSTLCFAMALHDLTEAPFRAMDEFDVFMDAVSRKISLDTLVDFALQQGSQWIFITPHDISMVKPDDRIKKQQLAAPRS